MRFRHIYVTIVVGAICGFLFNLFLRDSVVPLIYGYSPFILKSGSFERIEAGERTYPVRQFSLLVSFGFSIASCVVSLIAIYLKVYAKYYVNYWILVISLFITIAYIMAQFISKGATLFASLLIAVER